MLMRVHKLITNIVMRYVYHISGARYNSSSNRANCCDLYGATKIDGIQECGNQNIC